MYYKVIRPYFLKHEAGKWKKIIGVNRTSVIINY